MSLLLTVTGHTSTLTADFSPPIQLDEDSTYGLALIGFHSYNSIPNISSGRFYYFANGAPSLSTINIPTGCYEISDIAKFIQKHIDKPREAKKKKREAEIERDNNNKSTVFSLKPNTNTLQCEIYSKYHTIDFTPEDSIGRLLGFSPRTLEAGLVHVSDLPVNIVKVRTVHIDSNITSGAFFNNRPSHTIYEFAVREDPGFAIDETPSNLIYLPVNKTEIHNITLNILDQDFCSVNFRGETIIIRLVLRKLS